MILDEFYPGNTAVIERLVKRLSDGGLVAFTGAGTSMPAMPSWSQLVDELLQKAFSEGRIDEETRNALSAEGNDVLDVIDEIYSASGAAQRRRLLQTDLTS